ncbi:hypothetical protein AVEN_70922-1 [Araneus ventricosus]|uniref:Uncharacterized protein n=1 Tax=Araneus ventricosus TaxID=182803 RepID=A0A4Y2RIH3_ARAVE|nr:hypothetical protein AVEN_70922-1 [Araneus ventricosus]
MDSSLLRIPAAVSGGDYSPHSRTNVFVPPNPSLVLGHDRTHPQSSRETSIDTRAGGGFLRPNNCNSCFPILLTAILASPSCSLQFLLHHPAHCNSCFTILLKLELSLVEQRRTFVFEWIAFSNFTYNVKDFSSKVYVLSSFENEELDSDSSYSQKSLVLIILAC